MKLAKVDVAQKPVEELWSVEQAARATHVSEENIRRMCRSKRIKHCVKVGQQWAINPKAEWPELFGGEAA